MSEELDPIISSGNLEELRKTLLNYFPFQVAALMGERDEEEQLKIFLSLPPQQAFETFELLPQKTQTFLLQQLPSNEAAHLLKSLSPDDRTSFLEDLPKETINELVKLLPYDERILTLTLLGYPEGSVGRLMTTDYLSVKKEWTIEKVLDHIKEYGHDSETIDYIYVVNDNGKLIDDIKLKEFLFVPRNLKVQNISKGKFIALSVQDDDETAINVFQTYDRSALPVVNQEGILLGIVTIDDVLRLSNEEATEDIQKLGGMEALDEPYMQAPFFELIKKRAGWLILLFIGEMLTATALAYFQDEIARAVVLALFLPLVISSGGNAGSQASTLIIRAMALEEVKMKDWWLVIRREAASGLVLGSILGFIGLMRVVIWSRFSNIYGEHWFLIGLTVCLSLIGVVLWGTLSGAFLPLLLRLLRIDPATSSAPFVATLVDVSGLLIYFGIASCLLRGTLL